MKDQPLLLALNLRNKKINDEVFALNNQTLYGLTPEKANLLKALKLSLGLKEEENVIQEGLHEFLKKLIQNSELPYNLYAFQENLLLFKEFIQNPSLSLFDKVNIELFSLKYQVKILVYWISEDLTLNCHIFNRKYNRFIEIFRHKDNIYDILLHEKANIAEICSSLVSELIEKSLQHVSTEHKIKPHHKRSFSDICLNNEEEPPFSAYNPFGSLQPPDNFWKLAKESKKTPNISNFSSFDQISSDSLNQLSDSVSPTKKTTPKNEPLKEKNPKKRRNEHRQKKKFTGHLKFFDEAKNYGFFVIDEDKSDIFVHYDDLAKAKVTKEILRKIKFSRLFVKFAFNSITYIGKYNRSRKAIDIELMNYPQEFNC